jgi:hypothetical protein
MAPRFDLKLIPRLCAYCGRKKDLEREHVIPRAFNPAAAGPWQPAIVWGCKRCNKQKAILDEFMRDMLVCDYFADSHPVARTIRQSTLQRALVSGHSKKFRKLLAQMKPETIYSKGGIILGEGMGASLEDDPVTPWLTYVVQGLTVACFKTRLPAGLEFSVSRFMPDGYAWLGQTLPTFHARTAVRIGRHTTFTQCQAQDEPPGVGIWVTDFFGVVLVTYALPAEALAEGINSQV